MLVLARKIGEKIIVNDNIEIIVLDANQNTVKIGVNAPKSVSVYREELYKDIKRENESSRNASADSVSELYSLLKDKNKIYSNPQFDKLTAKIRNEKH